MKQRVAPSKKAFTLVEMMVVVAILGILVGLLLPAVVSCREAARRFQCMNKMAQQGIAFHNFELSYATLPSGVTNPTGPIRYEALGEHTSWAVRILPFIDQPRLRELYDPVKGAYAPENRNVRGVGPAIFRCPSSSDHTITTAHLIGDSGYQTDSAADAYSSSYAGCSNSTEMPIDQENDGVLFLNSRMPYDDIADGTSHTLLIAEKRSNNDRLGWLSGTRDTLRNAVIRPDALTQLYDMAESYDMAEDDYLTIDEDGLDAPDGATPDSEGADLDSLVDDEEQLDEEQLDEELQVPTTEEAIEAAQAEEGKRLLDPLYVGGFSSHHIEGFNAVRCDGSVHFISNTIDKDVLRTLGNRTDGLSLESKPHW